MPQWQGPLAAVGRDRGVEGQTSKSVTERIRISIMCVTLRATLRLFSLILGATRALIATREL
jgi:hypothetical protein